MRLPDALRRTLWSSQALIWLASWLVPGDRRREWRRQRSSAVWHWTHFLAESGQLNRENRMILARHCWGAFPEAWWQRFDRERMGRLRIAPGTCLAVLALALVVSVVTGGSISSLRSAFSTPISHPEQVYSITVDGRGLNARFQRIQSQTLLDFSSVWQNSGVLNGAAVYSWGPAKFDDPEAEIPILAARVSADFFDVLGVKAIEGRTFQPGDALDCLNCVLLSHEFWRSRFHSDPGFIGRRIVVDGLERKVIGVLPANLRMLSSGVAVWTLLTADTPPFSNFVRRVGAITRLEGIAPAKVQATLTDVSEDAGYRFPDEQLQVTSVQAQWRDNARSYIFFLLLVVVCAVLAVYARGVGAGVADAPLSWRHRVRWWAFFAVKSTLLLAVMFMAASGIARFVSVNLTGSPYPVAGELAMWLFFILAILGLSWSIHDQRKRCRICLRQLGMAVEIGRTGCVLLNWAGTELVCPDGSRRAVSARIAGQLAGPRSLEQSGQILGRPVPVAIEIACTSRTCRPSELRRGTQATLRISLITRTSAAGPSAPAT